MNPEAGPEEKNLLPNIISSALRDKTMRLMNGEDAEPLRVSAAIARLARVMVFAVVIGEEFGLKKNVRKAASLEDNAPSTSWQ